MDQQHDVFIREPYALRLVIHRESEAYTARFVEPDRQETEPFSLKLPLGEDARDDLSWYLEEYIRFVGEGDRARASKLEQRIDGWGRALHDALFESAEGARVHMRLMDAADAKCPTSLTIGSVEPEVHVQPWEMMRDRQGPLAFRGVTIRRQLQGAGAGRRHRLPLPLRVLLITARPREAGFIDPRTSVAPMLDALDALESQVVVEYCEPPTLARLEERISEARRESEPFHIVHFDGHGTYLPETGVGALAFERDESGVKAHLVAGRVLGDLLSRLDVPLVMLEACRGSALSERPIFGSVAPALLASGVGSVVAFSHSIHVEAARLLVERFYQELVRGRTVGDALGEARTRLRFTPSRWLALGPDPDTVDLQDWFVPQLYQVGPDPALVSLDDDRPTTAEGTTKPRRRLSARLHGFPPPPLYSFHGRALELLELERAFRVEPAVLLTGMGGMGKTALAREAAVWWLRKNSFEAAVFHSFEQKAGAARVVQVLGTALEGAAFSSRPAQEQWDVAVDLFHERRVLLVWDNFESTLPAFQVSSGQKGATEDDGKGAPLQFDAEKRRRLQKLFRELTEDDPAGRLLVTCRPQETGLSGIKESPLGGLARPDSLHLLKAVLLKKSISSDRKGYGREAVDALLEAIDDHPLSISLVAPHFKTLTPLEILTELRDGLYRFADASAEEARNRSLLASLAFSTRRLSEAARGVLPYLAWFEGGTLESRLLDFTQLDTDAWEAIRGELVATALIRVEEIATFNTPFLRFHPTLPYAARPEDVEEVEMRFIAVYVAVRNELDKAFHGSQPAAGMALLSLEETNFRSALRRAFRRGARREGTMMADTLDKYLEMAGRVRERDDFVAWVRSQLPEEAGFEEATCVAIRRHAMGLLSQGKADEAEAAVRGLIARLEAEGLAGSVETASHIATSYLYLGRIYVQAKRPNLALEPTRRAIALVEKLPGDAARVNLSPALEILAYALCALGRFDEAMTEAERALAITRKRSDERSIAVGLGQIAKILRCQQRYAEADVRYGEALDAARSVGDLGLQGTFLQHQAGMQHEIGNSGRAVELYKMALVFFQQEGNDEGETQICNALGNAETVLSHFDAAEAWYSRSCELAEKRDDRYGLGVIAQSVGSLHQRRAEQAGDDETRGVHLRRAMASMEESLAFRLEMEDQIGVASSYFQLGQLQRMLGELDRAGDYMLQSLRILEPLNLPQTHMIYASLVQVARDRGDAKAVAEWQAKYDAKVAELERLRRGDGPAGVRRLR